MAHSSIAARHVNQIFLGPDSKRAQAFLPKTTALFSLVNDYVLREYHLHFAFARLVLQIHKKKQYGAGIKTTYITFFIVAP